MRECPYCFTNYGLYSNEYVRYSIFYDFDGNPEGGGDLISIGTTLRRKTTPLYCVKCGKKVTTLERLQQEIKQNE